MDYITFRGGPAEVGRAQALLAPERVRAALAECLAQPHDLERSYLRRNLAFLRQEFPQVGEQLEAFAAAAGIENLETAYYLHIYSSGRPRDRDLYDGCTAFGLVLPDEGPTLVNTEDTFSAAKTRVRLEEIYLGAYPNLKPHGWIGIAQRPRMTTRGVINDNGLMVGCASAHPKFNWPDRIESVNRFWYNQLVLQYCADCEDVRHFAARYPMSGVKGQNLIAVDRRGNMVALELESARYALREVEPGEQMLLAVNHWQDAALQAEARAGAPDFWGSTYYDNSQQRIGFYQKHRQELQSARTLRELADVLFRLRGAPGHWFQVEGSNPGDWCSAYVVLATSRNLGLRVHSYPLEPARLDEAEYPGWMLPV